MFIRIPRELRGEEHVDNLVTLCKSCHEAIKTVNEEYAYYKCMENAIKTKTLIQKRLKLLEEYMIIL